MRRKKNFFNGSEHIIYRNFINNRMENFRIENVKLFHLYLNQKFYFYELNFVIIKYHDKKSKKFVLILFLLFVERLHF